MKTFIPYILGLLLLVAGPSYGQQKTISGTVSADGAPIPGVSVLVKGTSIGVVTDFDGNFTISVKNTDVLLFSYVGYITKEVLVDNVNKV